MTLEEIIDQQINLGHKDPHEFYDLVARALGDELIEIVTPYLADFISEMGRQRLNAKRRASIAKITAVTVGDPETLLLSMWVPSKDGTITYKPVGEMTVSDFESRADYLEHMADGIHRSAQWCRDCADKMRHEKVKTAKRLSSLPPLPVE